jgi:hypothetical protein
MCYISQNRSRARILVCNIRSLSAMCALASVQALVSADSLGAAQLRTDARLERRLSIAEPRIYIGDLLRRLSKETGIDIAADENDGASDIEIAAFLNQAPIGEVMNSVWSLVSYKGAIWHWARTGDAGTFKYVLTRPSSARTYSQRLQREIQDDFEKQASVMLEAAKLSPEERKKCVSRMTESMFQDDDEVAKSLLSSGRLWNGLSTFGDSLSPDQKLAVLRGKESIRIPVGQLSEQGRAFVHSTWADSNSTMRLQDGSTKPVPEPAFVMFESSRGGKQIEPTLYIHLEGIGGYGYLGGTPMHNGLRKILLKRWIMSDDGLGNPSEQIEVSKASGSGEPVKGHFLERRFGELAKSVPFSILARLPAFQDDDPGRLANGNVGEILRRLSEDPFCLDHKWRSGMLLISYPTWFLDETKTVPLVIAREIKRREVNGGGLLTADDLFWAATKLSSEQLQSLSRELQELGHVAFWHDLFAFCGHSKGAASRIRLKSGLGLTEQLVAMLQPNEYMKSALENEDAVSIRLTQEDHSEGTASREITLGIVTSSRKWVPVLGFVYPKRTVPVN